MTIRVAIADDHAVVRQGLRTFLELQEDMEVVGEAVDGADAVDLVERAAPDVVLLDLVMPRVDGIEATRRIRERSPATRILVLTSFADDHTVLPAVRAGAAGYLLKEAAHTTILRAIERVASGGEFVDPALATSLVASDREALLTNREREILQLLADGMSNGEVAKKLFISQETVKSHVRHILAKLEADTRTQAVAIALREAIIE